MSKFVCKHCGNAEGTTSVPNNIEGKFYGNQQLEEFFVYAYGKQLSVDEIECWFLDNGKFGEYCPKCHNVEISREKKDGRIIEKF